ncbi:MAG: hypothetical protein JSW22_01555 [Chloroflexota bacterium]|nr:MAG: hypothetical protein JSW22_01555 [Chloroflexota bacterium]
MKKRILTFGAVLVLVIVLAVPGVVLGADTTVVSGTVIGAYVFEAPWAVEIGSMGGAGVTWYGHTSTPGYFWGNSPAGYTVSGADIKATNAGYMTNSGGTPLTNKLEIGEEEYIGYVTADVGITYIDSSGPASDSIDLYVSQLVDYTDEPGEYSLNITFTVVEKS